MQLRICKFFIICLVINSLAVSKALGRPTNREDSISSRHQESIVLINNRSLKSQITQTNTIYIIRDVFDLKKNTIEIPSDCILKFEGGVLRNGIIKNCGIIDNPSNCAIFNEILFITPNEQPVKLSWFLYNSDADALENASKFKYVDGTGKWVIDKTVTINNDFQLTNGDFSCLYGITNISISSQTYKQLNYSKVIQEGATELSLSIGFDEAEAVAINSEDIYYKTKRNTSRNGTRGEIMLIKDISPKKVLFNTRTGTILSYSKNARLYFFKPLVVSLTSCSFHSDYSTSSDKGGILVRIGYAKANISNCSFKGCSVGLALSNCYNSIVNACVFESIYPWAIAFTGGTCNSSVSYCIFDTNRHGWTTLGETGVVKFCQITNNICRNSQLAFCSHPNAFGITISGNYVMDSYGGLGTSSPNTIIKNNTITNLSGFPAIYLTEAGGINPIVEGNVIENCKGFGGAIRNDDVDLKSDICCIPISYCDIKANTIRKCPDFSGITCDYSKVNYDVTVSVSDNTINEIGYTAIHIKSRLSFITGNHVNKVLRTNYTPITVQCLDGSSSNRNAYIVGNNVTGCTGDSDVHVKGYSSVVIHSNDSFPKELKVKFEKCTNIKREN